ncbi:MAG TPA: DUF2330 domain-containing protein, partial [Polyangiaceae bacterium]|nr:DUF2330 domain-containing protein [Polyangiaceae bacterium]
MIAFRKPRASLLGLFATLLVSSAASAFPGFIAGKKETPRVHSSQVAIMKRDATTVVSVMPDYEGSLEPFAVVLAVPADAGQDHVITLKREFIDRLDSISAPRFHEYWEQDPCDPGPVEQEWERNLKVQGGGFLGGGAISGGEKKVAKELFIDVTAKQKEGEYTITVLGEGESPVPWLKGKGYTPPAGVEAAIAPYLAAKMRFAVAEVDTKRIELIGGDRAQLSPIRFYTEQPYDTLPVKIGMVNAAPNEKQELLVYTIDPEQQYEAKNYANMFPPTNIEIDFAAKERMGEFYNNLHDIIQQKHPKTFLIEYAWNNEGCGKPCATEPPLISELLSLGADVFEKSVPEEERNPEPPALTKEEEDAEKAMLKELKPKERKERKKVIDEERKTVAARKALIERHKYTLTRIHYRYDASNLPEDPKFGPGTHVEGGVALPKGPKKEASTEVKPAAKSQLQTRYNNFHPWKPVIHCQSPERSRWGKSPPDYRGLRKTWITDDLARKSRTQIKAAEVVITPLPDLGLKG